MCRNEISVITKVPGGSHLCSDIDPLSQNWRGTLPAVVSADAVGTQKFLRRLGLAVGLFQLFE